MVFDKNDENNDYLIIFHKFVEICEKNKLWFSLANDSLLSAKTGNNYFKNSGIIEVFVTLKTFNFLKQKYRNNLIDFTYSDVFFLNTPFFYIKNIDKFIKIIIIVPTSVKKIKKIYSFKNKINSHYSDLLTFKKGYNFSTKTIFFFLKFISPFLIPIEQNYCYDLLNDEKYTGFLGINSLTEPNYKNWFPNLTFEVEIVFFLGVNTPIIKEYQFFLDSRYGEGWENGVEIKNCHFLYNQILEK